MVGCKTVLAKRKLVPDQKASRAVPPRADETTGMATDKLVASKAVAKAKVMRAEKAKKNSRLGLKTGLFSITSTEPESAPFSLEEDMVEEDQ